MAALTATYYAPPPTFNTLDGRQRARLIRSTRKLGDVLGTTPLLVEEEYDLRHKPLPISPPSRDRKRRQGSIFEFPPPSGPYPYNYASSSANSSVSSLALPRSSLDSNQSDASAHSASSLPTPKSFSRHVREKSKGKRTPLPTPLVLRLNAVPLPPSDPRVQPPTPDTGATLTPSNLLSVPHTTGLSLPVTPTTPRTPSTPTVTETRRKRLAKLKRTLGENVPAELIMPVNRLVRPNSTSPIHPPAAPQDNTPPARSAVPRPQHPRTQKKSVPPPSAARAPAKTSRRRSMSVDLSARPTPPPPPSVKAARPRAHARSPSHSPPVTSPRSDADAAGGWVTGASSWTGEWNRKDIREVQSQLRNLRLR